MTICIVTFYLFQLLFPNRPCQSFSHQFFRKFQSAFASLADNTLLRVCDFARCLFRGSFNNARMAINRFEHTIHCIRTASAQHPQSSAQQNEEEKRNTANNGGTTHYYYFFKPILKCGVIIKPADGHNLCCPPPSYCFFLAISFSSFFLSLSLFLSTCLSDMDVCSQDAQPQPYSTGHISNSICKSENLLQRLTERLAEQRRTRLDSRFQPGTEKKGGKCRESINILLLLLLLLSTIAALFS